MVNDASASEPCRYPSGADCLAWGLVLLLAKFAIDVLSGAATYHGTATGPLPKTGVAVRCGIDPQFNGP